MRLLIFFPLAFLLASCANVGTQYAPPYWRQAMQPQDRARIGEYMTFVDRNAADYVLNDIILLDDNTPWRWAAKRPAMRFRLKSITGRKLVYDITVPEVEFQSTGPVRIQIYVNNHLAEEVNMDQPARRVVEKPIPAAWLTTAQENVILAEADKLFYEPGNPQGRGFIINQAGFR